MLLTWLAFLISAIGVIMIPAIALLFRAVVKWTKTESKVDVLVKQLTEQAADSDKVHTEMYNQMREDRAATNHRLEFLERLWIERSKLCHTRYAKMAIITRS
jgi:hypothetical protein